MVSIPSERLLQHFSAVMIRNLVILSLNVVVIGFILIFLATVSA